MAEIYLNYRDTIKKAKDLEELATKVQKVSVNNLRNVEQRIGSAWKGDAGGAYRKKYDKAVVNLNNQGKNLKRLAEQLERSARRLQNLEELANQIFGG